MNNNLDPMGIGKALKLFPEQIKRTFEEALASNIERINFDRVVVSGMGGSSNAGKIIKSVYEQTNDIELTVYNSYGLPKWVNKKTLVILNSYSGNTEETLSSYEPAKKTGCTIVGLTTGGKIKEMIDGKEIKGAIISAGNTNPSGYPKSGLGLSLGGLLGVLVKVGYLNLSLEDLNKSLSELVKVRQEWNVESLAGWMGNCLPVFFSSHNFIGSLNAARNACCEIGRVYTQFYDFPEVNHVLIEALQKPENTKNMRYIFFESANDSERIKLRYKITKDILTEMGLNYSEYVIKSSDILSQNLEIAHYGAWLGYHLSMLRKEDPGPEPWILKLKKAL